MTVLLVGIYYGHEFDMLAEAVEERGSDAVVVDTEEWPSDRPLSFDPSDGTVTLDDETVAVDDVEGVFVRHNGVFVPAVRDYTDGIVSEDDNPYAAITQLREYRGLVRSVLRAVDAAGGRVLPGLDGFGWQEASVAATRRLDRAGLPVPTAVATADGATARAFLERHERVVCKPVAEFGGVKPLTADDADVFNDLSTPVFLQELVPGDDVRVYVVDGSFEGAFEYTSDTEGFSFKSGDEPPTPSRVELPAAAVEDAREAVAVSPMSFAAVDLRVTEESHTVLEVNAGGRFAASDEAGITDVTDALADALVA